MSIRKLAGETAIYGISSILGRILNFLLVPLFTTVLPREEYANIVTIYASIAFLMVFFTYRMEVAYFRFGTDKTIERRNTFNTALTSLLVSTLLLAFIVTLFVPQYASFYSIEDLEVYLYMCVGILCLDALCELPYAELRLQGRPIRFATIRLVNIFVNLGLNLFFLLLCPWILLQDSLSHLHSYIQVIYNPEIKIAYIFIANLVASLISFLLLLPSFKQYHFLFDRKLWQRMMQYVIPLVIVGLAYLINENLDKLLLEHLLTGTIQENKAALGEYGACYKLAIIIALFTQAFRYGAEPFFFRNKDEKNANFLYAQVAKYFLVFGTIGFLVVVLYIDLFKYLIPNETYWNGLSIIPIILIANVLAGVYYNFSVWYKLIDKTYWGAIISVGGAIITIVVNIWWIPIIGYMGSAWATLICYAAMTITCYLLGKRFYPINYPIGRMLLYLCIAVGVYQLSEFIRNYQTDNLWVIISVNTILLLFYLGFIYMLERKELAKIV